MNEIEGSVVFGAAIGIAVFGLFEFARWLRNQVIDAYWRWAVKKDRRHALAHPERDDLGAVIARAQERFRR